VVLGEAALFESTGFTIALRQFRRLAGATPFWEFAHRSKDPTTYTVLAEDSAALVGLAIAAVGIPLSHLRSVPGVGHAALDERRGSLAPTLRPADACSCAPGSCAS